MTDLNVVREILVASLRTRFDNVINLRSDAFDSKYIVSTLMDPATAYMLLEEEAQLLALVRNMVCYFN